MSPQFLRSLLALIASMTFSGCELTISENRRESAQSTISQRAISAAEFEQFLENLPGVYSNRLQFERSDESLKVEPKIGEKRRWIDHQHATFKFVDVPSLAGRVVALEWRSGGPTGRVSRQRLWSFRNRENGAFMDFYSLKEPIDFENSAAFMLLNKDDVISYGNQCALPMQHVGNEMRLSIPETCRILSRSGRDMILSADIIIADTIRYKESGRLIDGTQIFEVPGVEAYEFDTLEANPER